MIIKLILSIALSFISKAISKWGHATDWSKVKSDLDARVRKLIPGELIDDEVVFVLNKVIDVAAGLLSSKESLDKIIGFVKEKKFAEAISFLKQLIIDAYLPKAQQELAALSEDEKLLAAIKAA